MSQNVTLFDPDVTFNIILLATAVRAGLDRVEREDEPIIEAIQRDPPGMKIATLLVPR
jgi:hypothetical protein